MPIMGKVHQQLDGERNKGGEIQELFAFPASEPVMIGKNVAMVVGANDPLGLGLLDLLQELLVIEARIPDKAQVRIGKQRVRDALAPAAGPPASLAHSIGTAADTPAHRAHRSPVPLVAAHLFPSFAQASGRRKK
jgi:hypothetical protein